eukprot:2066728-Pyramimonas_sp.AAC.1
MQAQVDELKAKVEEARKELVKTMPVGTSTWDVDQLDKTELEKQPEVKAMLESETWKKFLDMLKTSGVAPPGPVAEHPPPAAPGDECSGRDKPAPDLHEDMDLDELDQLWEKAAGEKRVFLDGLASLNLKRQKRGWQGAGHARPA